MKAKFSNKYFERLIIETGNCYTIKPEYAQNVSNRSQLVIFATELKDSALSSAKDISSGLVFETNEGKRLKLVVGCTITTTTDFYKTKEDLLKFYDETDEKISEFMVEYQESFKAKSDVKNVQTPRKKRSK